MSTATSSSTSPTVARSQSTSSRSHSYRPPVSELPSRTRSVAVRPATTSSLSPHHNHNHHHHHHHHSHSKSNSYDRRPPTNHAVFDNLARRDVETRASQPASSFRDSPSHRPQEPTAHSSESTRKHRRNSSSQSSHRNSAHMAAAASVTADGAPGPPQTVPASHLHSAAPAQPKRRTTIATPSGQWALGKTIGAGSMGKVKLAKNVETGEQVSFPTLTNVSVCTVSGGNINLNVRQLLKSYRGCCQRNIATRGNQKGRTAQRKSGRRVKLPLSAW